uniref:Uncharacterized protein n=1 Tax=viral metagenome TaxID=1070528 RepID=A0A6M3L2J3_9ZZZZ
MKHIMTSKWEFTEDPFPAYRKSLIFGRNKRDFAFLPVKDVLPLEDEDKNFILPENKFKVIKTKEKGTIIIVPGEDNSNRCLAMIGTSGGFRGDCGLKKEDSTAQILKICLAGSACDSSISIIALFDVGQKILFYSYGRRNNDVIIHEWTGKELVCTSMTKAEYESCKICSDKTEVEEL